MDRLYRLSQEERGAIREQIAAELSHEPEDTMRRYLSNAPLRRHTTKETFGDGESHDSNEGSPRTETEG